MLYVIDGTDHIFGRLASRVAKKALEGHDVRVFNAEKIIMTGDLDRYREKYEEKMRAKYPVNPKRGPFFYRSPDRFFRRAVKQMLPRRKPKGKYALRRVKVFVGVPVEYERLFKKRAQKVPEAYKDRLLNPKYFYIGDLLKLLGRRPRRYTMRR